TCVFAASTSIATATWWPAGGDVHAAASISASARRMIHHDGEPPIAHSVTFVAERVYMHITMRVMVMVKATPEFEAGAIPDTKMMSKMATFNAELVKAGVM